MAILTPEIWSLIAVPLGFIIIDSIFMVTLIFQSRKRYWHLPFLIIAYIISISVFGFIVIYSIGIQFGWPGMALLKVIEPYIATLSLIFFNYHYEAMYSRSQPMIRRIIPYSVTAGGIGLIGLYSINQISFSLAFSSLAFLNNLMYQQFSFFALYVTYKNQKHANNLPTKIEHYSHYLTWLGGGFGLGVLNLMVIFGNVNVFLFIQLLPLIMFPTLIGTTIVIINYIVNPDYIYGIPHPVHMVIIYNEDSIPIYNRFCTTPIATSDHIDRRDLSAVFSAISSYINTIGGDQKNLNSINYNDLKVVFRPVANSDNIVAFIASYTSYYFIRAVDRFSRDLSSEILDQENIRSDLTYFNEIDELLLDLFPYIDLLDTDKKARERVYKEIVNRENVDPSLQIEALLQLLEFLMIDYQMKQEEDIISDIWVFLDKLKVIAKENELFDVIVDLELIKANLNMLTNKPNKAFKNWEDADALSKQYNLNMEGKIEEDKNRIIKHLKGTAGQLKSESEIRSIMKELDMLRYIRNSTKYATAISKK